ncbi:nucleotidyltransferase [Planctomycetales bacterium]|nr:nucleotidyltransferase [Planctomycetales bacterium]GHT39414.1 nucleotidyltransferase [Planctomycetales bacterium]
MNRFFDKTKTALTELKSEVTEKYYVETIGLFGSVVRDDFVPEKSDIDIVVSFSRPVGIEFIDLADFLEKKLNRKIDLVSRSGMKDRFFNAIKDEVVYV